MSGSSFPASRAPNSPYPLLSIQSFPALNRAEGGRVRPLAITSRLAPEKTTPRRATGKFRCDGRRLVSRSGEAQKKLFLRSGPAAIDLSYRWLRGQTTAPCVSLQPPPPTR